MSFSALLQERIAAKGTSLCLGLDPHRHGALPPFLSELSSRSGWPEAVRQWGSALIETASKHVPAVKLQSAFFEAMGWQGMQVLGQLCELAHSYGLLIILDAKRGDIASTMAAYGEMAFETLAADALTIQPYMGFDVVAPLTPWLAAGKGIYVVWLTSNQDGQLLQSLTTATGQGLVDLLYAHFYERLEAQGLSGSLGLVVGATRIDELSEELFAAVKRHPLLLPGIGEQGASRTGRLAALLTPASIHLQPMSRSLTGIGSQHTTTPLNQATTLTAYLTAFEQGLLHSNLS